MNINNGLIPDWQSNQALYRILYAEHLPPPGEKRANKISSWVKLLGDYCRVHRRVSFTITELQSAFERPIEDNGASIRPRCFPQLFPAIPEYVQPAEQLRQACQAANDSILSPPGWAAWLFDKMVASPVKAALSQRPPITPATQFVFVPRLQQLWESFQNALARDLLDVVDRVFPEAEILQLIQRELGLEAPEARLFLCHIGAQRGAVRFSEGRLVGYMVLDQGPFDRQVAAGILHIKHQVASLGAAIQRIQDEIAAETREAVLAKQRSELESAKRRLRHRALLRNVLSQREEMLETFKSQLVSVRSASSMVEILQALQLGSNSLEIIQQNTSSSLIADTLSSVEETLDTQRELDTIMTERMKSISPEDEDELLRELATLTEENIEIPVFPAIPTTQLPTSSSSQQTIYSIPTSSSSSQSLTSIPTSSSQLLSELIPS